MKKKICIRVAEFIIIVFSLVLLLIGLTGGFSFVLGPLHLKAHSFKNPVIILIVALFLRKMLSGRFIEEFFGLSFFQCREIRLYLSRLARKFAESPRFRKYTLGIFLIVLFGMLLAVIANPLQRGLTATYYLNAEWSGEPELRRREQRLNLWRIKSEFPAASRYSILWKGEIFIPGAGEYQFGTASDDRSELFIDDQLIVDNNGVHGLQERTGSIHLKKGFYPITLRSAEFGGAVAFRAFWSPPEKDREDLAQALLFARMPTQRDILVGKVLEIFLVIGACFCFVSLILATCIWLNGRHILRTFLKNSFIGQAYQKCLKEGVRKKGIPEPVQKSAFANLFALSGYTLLSLIWTYPLIKKFSTEMVGLGGDRYIYLWDMWWVKKALLELFANPFHTDYIFYPKGIGLGFHDFTFFNSLLSIPLQWAFSLTETYNILFLLTFILGGFGCSQLVKYLTGDHLAAFFSGLVFAFWGARMYNVDHLSLASIQWFPFSALYLLKTLRESSYRNPILAAFFLVFNALSSLYYAVYMVIFAALFFLYCLWIERKRFFTVRCLKRFALMGGIFTMIMLPVLFPLIAEVLEGQEYMNSPVLVTDSTSPNVLLLPSVNHEILGKYVRYFYASLGAPMIRGLTGGSFIGYSVLFLSLYAMIKLRHLEKKFWLLAGVVFLVLSLGPYFQFFSKVYTNIPLPYQLFQRISILKALRVPVRFMMVVMLCCSVLCGYACWDIFRRIRYKILLFSLLAGLLLFEYVRVYYVRPLEEIPAFYREISQDTEVYTILELTTLMNWPHSAVRSSLFQTTHNKKLFHGHASRVSPETYQQAYAIYPVFDDFFTQPRKFVEQESSLDADRQKILALLSYYDVRYVALYHDYWRGNYQENLSRLKKMFGEPIAEQPGIHWFKIDKVPVTQSLVYPGLGMFPLNYEQDAPARQVAIRADIKVLNIEGHAQLSIRFEGKAYHLPQEEVEISANGTVIATFSVGDWTEVKLPTIPLKPGDNTIRLRTNNGHRKYGLRMRNITIELLN